MRGRRLFLLVPLLGGLLVSCAGPKPAAEPPPSALPPNIFVLLSDPDGKVGRIAVSNPQGTADLVEAGQATGMAKADEPPIVPIKVSDREVAEIFGPVLAAMPTPPVRFILYFERDVELATEAKQLVPQILAAIQERRSVDTSVVGHADTAGSREYNYRLSRRRAEAVAQLLVAGGVAPETLDVTSHGKDNPAVPTGDNVSEPRNRRVEVTVR